MGFIDAKKSFEKEKETVAKAVQGNGLKANFYEEGDYAEFMQVLHANVLDVGAMGNIRVEVLPYTYHKPITVMPVQSDETIRAMYPNLAYGFMRLGLTDTYIRPNLANLRSCHKVGFACRAENGNLGYISNPWWATYVLFGNTKKLARFGEGEVPEGVTDVKRGFPNSIASVNVLFGANANKGPVAVLSRMSGDANLAVCSGALTNLVAYLSSLGFQVRFTRRFLDPKLLGDAPVMPGACIEIGDENGQKSSGTVYSDTFLPVITADTFPAPTEKQFQRVMPFRFKDLQPARYLKTGECFEVLQTVGSIHVQSLVTTQRKGTRVTMPLNTHVEQIGAKVYDSISRNVLGSARHDAVKGLEAQKTSTSERYWSVCTACGVKVEHGNSSCVVSRNGKNFCESCANNDGRPKLKTKLRKPTKLPRFVTVQVSSSQDNQPWNPSDFSILYGRRYDNTDIAPFTVYERNLLVKKFLINGKGGWFTSDVAKIGVCWNNSERRSLALINDSFSTIYIIDFYQRMLHEYRFDGVDTERIKGRIPLPANLRNLDIQNNTYLDYWKIYEVVTLFLSNNDRDQIPTPVAHERQNQV